jgi:hypothetical protein
MSCKWKFTATLFVLQISIYALFLTYAVSTANGQESILRYYFLIYQPAVTFAAGGGPIAILVFIVLSMFVYSLSLGWLLCHLLRLETD